MAQRPSQDIPRPFRERYGSLVDDPEAFFASLSTLVPRSLRINRLKATADEVAARFKAYGLPIEPVPWYEDAFVCDDPGITTTIEFFLGAIYVQGLASMLPPLAIRKEVQEGGRVLDACAAPGSKTTQLAAIMGNRGLIVANDVNYGRIRALRFNMERCGVLNTVVTNFDLRSFPKERFDAVLLDAPCSGEGVIRNNWSVLTRWSVTAIEKIARLQRALILRAYDLLAPDGVLVYSTCTFAPEENEAVVDDLLKERGGTVEPVRFAGLKTVSGLTAWQGREFDGQLVQTLRIWPHLNDTEGFYLARVRK